MNNQSEEYEALICDPDCGFGNLRLSTGFPMVGIAIFTVVIVPKSSRSVRYVGRGVLSVYRVVAHRVVAHGESMPNPAVPKGSFVDCDLAPLFEPQIWEN